MKLLLITLLMSHFSMGQEIKIMSYNIRYGTADDGENHWEKRKNKVADLMNYYAPDFIGMQEAQKFQQDFLLQQMPQYASIGNPRTNEPDAEYSNIFYNKNRFKLIQQHTLWLSPTPDTISIGWDAALPRIATYGLFRSLEGKQFIWVINAHFDHVGALARLESAKLIVAQIAALKKINNCEVIFTGDLNARPEEAPVAFLSQHLAEARSHCRSKPYGEKDTWNGFNFKEKPNGQIDYIFVADTAVMQIGKYITIDDFYDFKYPSDHLPVMATLTY